VIARDDDQLVEMQLCEPNCPDLPAEHAPPHQQVVHGLWCLITKDAFVGVLQAANHGGSNGELPLYIFGKITRWCYMYSSRRKTCMVEGKG